DRDDRGMVQGGGALRLAPEPFLEVRVPGQIRAQHLHGDRPVQADVLRQEHLGHAALPEHSSQGVAAPQHHVLFAHSTPVLVPLPASTGSFIVRAASSSADSACPMSTAPTCSAPAVPKGSSPMPPATAAAITATSRISR